MIIAKIKLTKILAKIQLTQFIEKIKSTKIIAKIKLLTNHQLRLDFQTMSGFVTASKGECTDYLTAKGDLEVLKNYQNCLICSLSPYKSSFSHDLLLESLKMIKIRYSILVVVKNDSNTFFLREVL